MLQRRCPSVRRKGDKNDHDSAGATDTGPLNCSITKCTTNSDPLNCSITKCTTDSDPLNCSITKCTTDCIITKTGIIPGLEIAYHKKCNKLWYTSLHNQKKCNRFWPVTLHNKNIPQILATEIALLQKTLQMLVNCTAKSQNALKAVPLES
jgi:hypothetical protein